jgi:hypothetical protein
VILVEANPILLIFSSQPIDGDDEVNGETKGDADSYEDDRETQVHSKS